ncbi:MAG: M48 family metallopeptidase [Acidimicrobiales bacterium]
MASPASDWFSAVEVARGQAYNRPLERLGRIRLALASAVLVAFVVGQAAPRVLAALGLSSWAWEVVAVVVAIQLSSLVYSPWFAAHRSLFYDRRWGLSTQTPEGFVADQFKELVVVLATSLVLVVPLYAVIRATDAWWLFGWLVVAGFTVLASFLYPVVIAPVFNRFEPLEDDRLAARVVAVTQRAGIDVDRVVVADASRRSRAGNAYVAGLGPTRRVVLFDTILDWPVELVEQVVAHELGHWKHRHLGRRLPVVIGAQLVVFATAWAVLGWDPLLSLAGVSAVGDPASLPLLLIVLSLGLLATSLLASGLHRADERQADLFALELLGRPDRLVELLRRLARRNKADVDPSWWKRVTATHPPIAERMAMAAAWKQGQVPGGD